MALQSFTRAELAARTPSVYLAAGFGDGESLSGIDASAAAQQLLAGEVPPQELAFLAEAFDGTLEYHDGDAADRAEAAGAEAQEVVARLIRQPNNERLVAWFDDCVAHVRTEDDIVALQAHLDAVVKQYFLVAHYLPEESSSSDATA